MVKEVSEQEFYEEIKTGLVLVDFSAEWCGPCRMLAPVLEKVAEELLGVARVCKVDIDEAQRAAATFKVTSVPTLILFKNGDQVGRIVGVQDHTQIVKFVQGKV